MHPPSAEFDAAGLVARVGKGKPVSAIVEQVNSGSTLRVTLLPDLQSATVMVAGVQCPSMGRRPPPTAPAAAPAADSDGAPASSGPAAGSAAALVAGGGASSQQEVQPEPFAREARYFTELRCLNAEVKVVLEGVSQVGAQEFRGERFKADRACVLMCGVR
jgi:staphylococcal nuclease domain-containing protein 1